VRAFPLIHTGNDVSHLTGHAYDCDHRWLKLLKHDKKKSNACLFALALSPVFGHCMHTTNPTLLSQALRYPSLWCMHICLVPMRALAYVCVYVCVRVCVSVYVYVFACVSVFLSFCLSIRSCLCQCVCMCVCVRLNATRRCCLCKKPYTSKLTGVVL
jgi:hypothetical protein